MHVSWVCCFMTKKNINPESSFSLDVKEISLHLHASLDKTTENRGICYRIANIIGFNILHMYY